MRMDCSWLSARLESPGLIWQRHSMRSRWKLHVNCACTLALRVVCLAVLASALWTTAETQDTAVLLLYRCPSWGLRAL